MISFAPTDDQNMLVETIARFASNNMRTAAHEADEQGTIPESIIDKGWELGILPGVIPEQYGGYADEQSAITGVLALEELAWGDLAMALGLWTPALFALPILHGGTQEQKAHYLPAFTEMDRPIGTAALMEPGIKFDPWCPQTTATPEDGYFVINGTKTYVPLAVDAQRMIVFAANTETGQVDGYIVERDSAGVEIADRNRLMGIHALPTFEVNFNNVKIAKDRRLGGDAGTNYMALLSRSRIALGALAVGVARSAFEYARDYAKDRIQFGAPIATKQSIAFMLADIAIEIDAARLLVWEAAWKADQGEDLVQISALVKSQISKMALFATDSGVQILGGHGYIREHPVERWLRNGRGFAMFEGLSIV